MIDQGLSDGIKKPLTYKESGHYKRRKLQKAGLISADGHNGRLTQRESATFTRWKSLVQIQYRLP